MTDIRNAVLTIPIIALTVRENEALGNADTAVACRGSTNKKEVGKRDVEGVFVVGADNKVTFRPVKVGIAGEQVLRSAHRPEGRREDRRRDLPGHPRAQGRRAGEGAEGAEETRRRSQDVSDNQCTDVTLSNHGEHSLSTTAERRVVVQAPGVAPGKDWVIVTRGLKREYDMGGEVVRALRGVDLAIRRNEYVAIMGPSGSGKSTLMNLIGCLDTPNAGEYWLNGLLVSQMSRRRSWRACATRRSASSSRRSTCSPAPPRCRTWNCRSCTPASRPTSAKRRAKRGARAGATRPSHGSPPQRTVGRSAPARRHRARARERAVDPARRRADG